SSHVDRSVSADDSELNVESLIKNLKNVIIKKLSVSCVTRSPASSSAPSVPFFTTLPQSSTPVSVSGSPAPATSVPTIPTSATSGFTVSAFVTSSSHFKKMLHRLNEPHLSRITSLLNSVEIIIAPVSEAILIKDDNTAETTPSHLQAPLITFSPFSVEKVVRTLSHKHSALGGSRCCSFSPASPPPSVSSTFTPSALAPGPAGPALFFNFSTHTH
ncbi:uncharacterized protein BDCG_07614, partial [Blastomyces dermatitidis ER-3]